MVGFHRCITIFEGFPHQIHHFNEGSGWFGMGCAYHHPCLGVPPWSAPGWSQRLRPTHLPTLRGVARAKAAGGHGRGGNQWGAVTPQGGVGGHPRWASAHQQPSRLKPVPGVVDPDELRRTPQTPWSLFMGREGVDMLISYSYLHRQFSIMLPDFLTSLFSLFPK